MKLPRPRLTIRSLMILVAVVAFALPVWIVVDDFNRAFNKTYFPERSPSKVPATVGSPRPALGSGRP